jgi:hypothetical protein
LLGIELWSSGQGRLNSQDSGDNCCCKPLHAHNL